MNVTKSLPSRMSICSRSSPMQIGAFRQFPRFERSSSSSKNNDKIMQCLNGIGNITVSNNPAINLRFSSTMTINTNNRAWVTVPLKHLNLIVHVEGLAVVPSRLVYTNTVTLSGNKGDTTNDSGDPVTEEARMKKLEADLREEFEKTGMISRAAIIAAAMDESNPRRGRRSFISTERNFITPVRAMSDFLLKTSDLTGLRKTMRRSAHADEPPITVYWRRDVEQRAKEIWGTWDELAKEKRRRGIESQEYLDALSNIKRILKKYQREYKAEEAYSAASPMNTLLQGSGRIVLTAVTINGTNFVIKLLAWSMTGSHSLFAEAIHSLADTINQLILAYGIHKSSQKANVEHPYGYANMRHVASLISGVGIFCVGAGLSFYHGITGLIGMEPIESLYWAFYILAGSFVSEGATLFLAVNSVRKRAKALDMSFKDYILRGRDPSLNVVILEDTAAVAGVAVASVCMGLTMLTGSPIPDAVGSMIIGGLLGGVASFIIYSNSAALVGRSIPRDNLDSINAELEQDCMIRAIHDVKGIDMGNMLVRYKAEVDFDGRELTRAYLEKIDVKLLLEEVKSVKTQEDLENFLLKHGECIVDTLGAEIDRIETRLKQTHPEIRHCDLEIL